MGVYRGLENGPGLPTPFRGTRKELLGIITDTIHRTIDGFDYNGALPYVKLIDQLQEGKSFDEVEIDSRDEKLGSTCVGMSLALIKALSDEHKIQGTLACNRKKDEGSPLIHATVIIECEDGFVLLDPRSDPETRIYSIRFGKTKAYQYFSITASHRGSTTPLSEGEFEYCTNVGNSADLVIKHYMMEAPFMKHHKFVPLAAYNPDGSARKFIGINFQESKIFLKDKKEAKAQDFFFHQIRKNPEEFRQILTEFMAPNESFKGFIIPPETAYDHLIKLAFQESKIRKLFTESHPKSIT